MTGPALRTTHALGRGLTVSAGGVDLLTYTYGVDLPAFESPMPYFHPLRTLAGDVVTGHRPHDHRWHKGLAMTVTYLSGQNFWGGNTYVHGEPEGRYVALPNTGSVLHSGFAALGTDGGTPHFTEDLWWVTMAGEHWLDERRTVSVRDVTADAWSLDFATSLTNVRGQELEFGSPTTRGRPHAGYSGFFWRGPRDFTGGTVLGPGGRSGPGAEAGQAAEAGEGSEVRGTGEEMMGRAADWLAFSAEHDEVDRESTLVFRDESARPVPDGRWFVRSATEPLVNPSLAFHEPLFLADGATLDLRYRLVVANGRWDAARVTAHLAAHPW